MAIYAALGAADEPAGEEHEDASDDDLKGGLEKWRVHVAVANIADDAELDRDDDDRDASGEAKLWNQKRKCVPKAAGCGHQPGHGAANPW